MVITNNLRPKPDIPDCFCPVCGCTYSRWGFVLHSWSVTVCLVSVQSSCLQLISECPHLLESIFTFHLQVGQHARQSKNQHCDHQTHNPPVRRPFWNSLLICTQVTNTHRLVQNNTHFNKQQIMDVVFFIFPPHMLNDAYSSFIIVRVVLCWVF